MSEHLLQHGTRGPTSQRAKAPLTDQVPNSAGGFAWQIDKWSRLRRFLILGSEGGSYYASERNLTTQNVTCLRECIAEDGPRTVAEIVAISTDGRAPKNDTALYALASCMSLGDKPTKLAAGLSLPQVARIGTHLYDFVAYCESMRGWGRMMRKAVQGWYDDKAPDKLAYDAVKYRQRNGWSHRDLLRLSHPQGGSKVLTDPDEPAWATTRGMLYDFITHRKWEPGVLPILDGFVEAQDSTSTTETARLIRQYRLPRECVLTEHLNDLDVWQALLDVGMPMHALTRNLATLTRNKVLEGDYRAKVIGQFKDEEQIRRSRLHPYSLLLALATYRQGRGFRGSNTWTPIGPIVDALDEAFYLAFGNVQPTNKKILLALDVSGSMSHAVMGDSPITALAAAGAMAMVTGAAEPNADCVTFSNGASAWMKQTGLHQFSQMRYGNQGRAYRDGLEPFGLSKRRRLDDVVAELQSRNMGGTDCALPMTYATDMQLDYDAFVIYTDNETWAGDIHPFEALRRYRAQSGNQHARLVVVGMTSGGFTIADPNDPGMLDVVGFDTATPNMISEFVAGRL